MFARVRVALVPVLAAVAVAGLAGLTGCSGSGDRPQTLPPLSTTPAATSSPEPTATGKKAELAAATAVVRHYFQLLNGLSTNMNPAPFSALESANCPCRKFLKSLRDVAARGQHYFGHASLTSVTPAADSARLVEVLASYDSTRGGIKDADGRIVTSSAARRDVTALFYVEQHHGRWLVDRIVTVKAGRSE